MTTYRSLSRPAPLFGTLGLFLMLLIARLAPRAQETSAVGRRRTAAWLARLVIEVIGRAGTLIDRLTARSGCRPKCYTRGASPA